MTKRYTFPDGTTIVRGPKPTKAQKKEQKKHRQRVKLLRAKINRRAS